MTEAFSSQFRLSITKALGDQLAEELKKLTKAPLTRENLAEVDRQAEIENLASRSGVYQLYRRAPGATENELVYVGKSDKPLSQRLGNHLRKISGRQNISIDEISFKCLYVAEDFSAVAPEKLLIARYRKDGKIPWNTNGFGNKDPGRNRDGTVLKANHFDVLHPVDLERPIDGLPTSELPLAELLEKVKESAPYNFRYEESSLHEEIRVQVPASTLTADAAFRLISEHLPEGWQVAALMGYVIMYEDHARRYASAFRYYRDGEAVDAQPKMKAAGKIEEEQPLAEPEADGP